MVDIQGKVVDPEAIGINVFVHNWEHLHCPMFPPMILIGRVLAKLIREKVHQAILIVPHWPSRPWWPVLLSVMDQPPMKLPLATDLLTDTMGNPHPLILNNRMTLMACVVSGTC